MTYKIKEITEEDYGCEGVPDGGELMCSVLVDGADGKNGCVLPIDCCARIRSMSAARWTRQLYAN